MAIFNLFNTAKPKQFNYRPLYYDERKERLEKMKAAAEAEASGKAYHGLQRGFLKDQREQSKLRKARMEKGSILRWFIILLVILVAFYFIFPELFALILSGK